MSKNIVQVDPQKFPWLDLRRYTFTLGVESKGILYISGNTASAYDSEKRQVLCKGDVVEQAKLAFEKIGVVLEAAGMGFDNVVRTVEHLDPVALPQYRQVQEIRRQYLGASPAADSAFCVQRLLRPDALIEVSAVAMKDEKRAIDPGWGNDPQHTVAPGVRAGDTLWLSGFMGHEEVDGKPHFPQDTARQMELSYQAIDQVLKAAGAQPGDIVNSIDFIAPRAQLQYRNTAAVRKEFFNGQYPAATGILMNRLIDPEAHVEVETVAVTGQGRQEIRIPEWDKRYERLTYRPGIKKGRLLYIAGMAAVDHAPGQSVGGDDVLVQADRAYENLARVLAAGGYSMDDVVNTVEWVAPSGITGYRQIAEVRRKHFGDSFPTATGVQVYDLLRPELLIEVTAVAVV